jgi:hypothetical protein
MTAWGRVPIIYLRVELVRRDALPEEAGAPFQLLRPHELLFRHGLLNKLMYHNRHDHIGVRDCQERPAKGPILKTLKNTRHRSGLCSQDMNGRA